MNVLRAAAAILVAMICVPSAHAEMVLRRGIGYEPATLDPQRYNTHYEAAIILDLFEGLVTFDTDGDPTPGLAAKWSTSSDGRVWTFTLRPGLQWSDGVALTADDVVFSLRRLMDPKTAANYAPLLYVVKSGSAVNKGTLPVTALGVAAPNADTVVITLDAPAPYLPELFANAFLAVLPRHAVEKWGDAWIKPEHVVTDGAFTLSEWTPQNRIVLVRNAKYRDVDDVALDRVMYFPSADLDAAVTRFRAGELDIQSGFSSGQAELLRKELPGEVSIVPTLDTFYLALNTSLPKLADPRVRRALSLAIDRDVLATKVLRDGSVAATGLVPPTVSGYQPAEMDFLKPPPEARLAQARALLAEAGFGPDHPLMLTYTHSTVPEMKRIAVTIAAMWKRIGVDCRLSGMEGKVMFANLRQGDFEAAYAGWSADFDDAASFLYLLQSSSVNSNYSRYHNPAFDDLLSRAAAAVDRKARMALLREAETLALKDQPIVPLTVGTAKALVARRVHGWVPNPMDVALSRALSVDSPPP